MRGNIINSFVLQFTHLNDDLGQNVWKQTPLNTPPIRGGIITGILTDNVLRARYNHIKYNYAVYIK